MFVSSTSLTVSVAEIGGALGVDCLIVGDVGKVAENFMVSLRMLDVNESLVLSRVTESFRGQEEQLLPAVRDSEDWVATVLGVGLMVICVQIPSYYYALLLAYAFLWQRSEAIGVGLCGLSATSWLIAGAFGSRDEIFTWVSLASVLFVLFATLLAWQSARTAEQTRHASRAAPR